MRNINDSAFHTSHSALQQYRQVSVTKTKMNIQTIIMKVRPPRIATLLFLAFLGIHVFVKDQTLGDAWRAAGVLIFAGGFALMMWAWSLFRKCETPTKPTDQPKAFVAAGPYRFTRNPMYAGVTLMLAGLSLVMGSVVMLGAPLLFWVIINQFFVPFEENRMTETFGAAYQDYKKSVRRWI